MSEVAPVVTAEVEAGAPGASGASGLARLPSRPVLPRPPWHQRGRLAALAVAVLGSLLSCALLALMLLPGLGAQAAETVADGTQAFTIGGGQGAGDGEGVASVVSGLAAGDATTSGAHASVVPEVGWLVQPVRFSAAGTGLVVRSPDRVLTVELVPEAPDAEPINTSGWATETLATGLELQHQTVDGEFVGLLELTDGTPPSDGAPFAGSALLIQANVLGDADFEAYRPALATLLERITAEELPSGGRI